MNETLYILLLQCIRVCGLVAANKAKAAVSDSVPISTRRCGSDTQLFLFNSIFFTARCCTVSALSVISTRMQSLDAEWIKFESRLAFRVHVIHSCIQSYGGYYVTSSLWRLAFNCLLRIKLLYERTCIASHDEMNNDDWLLHWFLTTRDIPKRRWRKRGEVERELWSVSRSPKYFETMESIKGGLDILLRRRDGRAAVCW